MLEYKDIFIKNFNDIKMLRMENRKGEAYTYYTLQCICTRLCLCVYGMFVGMCVAVHADRHALVSPCVCTPVLVHLYLTKVKS